jgi:hypothetical protein
MKTILLSLLLAVATVGACVPAFLFGFGMELNAAGSSTGFVTVATWIAMILIGQPVVVIPLVIVRGILVGGFRLLKRV